MPSLLRGIRALLVEDDPDTLEMTALFFSDEGAHVVTTATVNEALEQLASAPFDVLVSDIGLAGGDDGHVLIRRLRASDGANSRIPAVALSAYARNAEVDRAIDAGFDVHAAKPILPDALLRLVASVVAQRRQR